MLFQSMIPVLNSILSSIHSFLLFHTYWYTDRYPFISTARERERRRRSKSRQPFISSHTIHTMSVTVPVTNKEGRDKYKTNDPYGWHADTTRQRNRGRRNTTTATATTRVYGRSVWNVSSAAAEVNRRI